MKIGIMGAGVVGQSLARAVVALGHEVMLSSRTPQSEQAQTIATATGAQIGTVAATLDFGELIALALGWEAVPSVVAQGDWAGKIVIDATNRFGDAAKLSTAQELQQLIPAAHVVKALNTIGAEHYQDPLFDGQAATMFIAGDNRDAKDVVTQLLSAMGFDVIDAGDLAAATHLEALAALWVHLAFRAGQGRNVAFKLLRK